MNNELLIRKERAATKPKVAISLNIEDT